MKEKKVTRGIPQPSLSFVNTCSGKILTDIWTPLEKGLWQEFLVDNYLKNDKLGEVDQNKWLPIFPNYKVINVGFRWDSNKQEIVTDLYKPQLFNADLNSFLNAAEKYFNKYSDKKIGVHLSGGLDSSLIICLLKHFNIPFVAIGLSSNRFEFRTEKRIQEILMEYADDALLLDMDEYPFYSNLEKKPKHQIPDGNIKMIDASTALAHEFAKRGCNVVFTGQGGDTLLTEPMKDIYSFEGYNIANEFRFPWEEDFIYAPLGIELVSFFSDKDIINNITSLRIGQGDDSLKIWARKFFKEYIPIELSEYAYFADFFGYSMSGLNGAIPSFKMLFEEAYDYLKHPVFSEKNIKKLINTDVLLFEYNTYCEFASKLSLAVWLHSLFRKDD